MTLAASHPERVVRLALFHPAARLVRADDYPWGRRPEEIQARQRELGIRPSDDAADATVSIIAPSSVFEVQTRLDLRPLLPTITTPTIVLSRPAVRVAHQHARYVAERIQGSGAIEYTGADMLVYVGDDDRIVSDIEEFITGVRSRPPGDRVLATVLFSDIVDSTAQAAAIGDRAWRDRLDAHDAMVRRRLGRFRGREIDTTGDGFLATFLTVPFGGSNVDARCAMRPNGSA
jgi:hypothetical protein